MYVSHKKTSKSKMHIKGFLHILSNPYLFRRLIVRELFHRRRLRGKREWIKWQIYDALTSMPHHGSSESLSQPLNRARIETIKNMVQAAGQNLRILDVGCGDGSIGRTLRKMGHEVTSIELPQVASLAKNDYNVRDIVAGDAEAMPFKSESFDVVIAAEIFEHLWNPKAFFKESHRILRCGGHLILSSLEGPEALRYDTHKQYVTIEVLKKSLEESFNLRELIRLEAQGAAPTYTMVAMLRKI